MPNYYDRKAFEEAINSKNQDQIRAFLQREDAKRLLFMEHEYGRLPIHDACRLQVDTAGLQLILDAAVQHGVAKEMLEAKNGFEANCLHHACGNNLSTDSLHLLFEYLLKHADIKKVLEAKDWHGHTCLHYACANKLSVDCLQLFVEYLTKHADLTKVLEEKTCQGWTCLHLACSNQLPPDSLRLLLEYLTKHADIKKVLEEKDGDGQTCLHCACLKSFSADSLRLLISFFPSKDFFATALDARDREKETPIDYAEHDEVKQLLQDPDCFEQCRLWLLRNHEDTFLYARYLNSLEKTCHALKELPKSALQHSQQHATIILIALMSSASIFRDAVNKTDSSAPMESYLSVVKKGDTKSDYNHWRKNFHLFRDFSGQWPPSARKTATTYEGEGSSSCTIQ